jgi:hypothetical protein
MASIKDIERVTRTVTTLVLHDARFAPVFDRLAEELEKAQQASPKERARASLKKSKEVRGMGQNCAVASGT